MLDGSTDDVSHRASCASVHYFRFRDLLPDSRKDFERVCAQQPHRQQWKESSKLSPSTQCVTVDLSLLCMSVANVMQVLTKLYSTLA